MLETDTRAENVIYLFQLDIWKINIYTLYIFPTDIHARIVIWNLEVDGYLQGIVASTVPLFRIFVTALVKKLVVALTRLKLIKTTTKKRIRNWNAVACSTKALQIITNILDLVTLKNKHLHVKFVAKCVLQELHIMAISTDTVKRINMRARFVISVSIQRKVGVPITALFMKGRSTFVIFVGKKLTVNRAW